MCQQETTSATHEQNPATASGAVCCAHGGVVVAFAVALAAKMSGAERSGAESTGAEEEEEYEEEEDVVAARLARWVSMVGGTRSSRGDCTVLVGR